MNRMIIGEVKESKNFSGVDIVMRLEIGIPFMLDFPLSVLAALLFVFTNLYAERIYFSCNRFVSKFYVLTVSAFINTMIFVLGNMLKYPPIYPRGEKLFIDSVRIKGNILFGLFVMSIMFCFRTVYLLVEHYLCPWLNKRRLERQLH
jgi:hypothetical protein